MEYLRHVYSASKAFGEFQKMLEHAAGERLHETIPNFPSQAESASRAFLQASGEDALGRASSARLRSTLC